MNSSSISAADIKTPDFNTHVVPIFKKYCTGCHNASEAEGELVLDSYKTLLQGGAKGPAFVAKRSGESRLIRMLTGQQKPIMPPKGNPAPTAAEIATLTAWIDAGAAAPAAGDLDVTVLVTPKIVPQATNTKPITAVAAAPDGQLLAVGRYRSVQLVKPADRQVLKELGDHAGKITSVSFSRDGKTLVAGSGIAGLSGEARVWNVAEAKLIRTITGHRDILYAAVLSPDGQLLATGSYDKDIILWNMTTGEKIRTLSGHNQAIHDLAFSPDGSVLASASGDATVKLWQVSTGIRLDTLSQPLKEQYTVTFSPDSRYILAGGADNRIRVWEFVSKTKPQINPLAHARLAHEGAITRLVFSADGKRLVSTAEDRTIKLWETERFSEIHLYPPQPDIAASVAFVHPGQTLAVGRLDGSLDVLTVVASNSSAGTALSQGPAAVGPASTAEAKPNAVTEAEPNDTPAQATRLTLPAVATGVIQAPQGGSSDVDLYQFEAKAGESWILEINAARSKSPLDSKVEILDTQGKPVLRTLLQAVRDSYVTFRGIDSTSRDVRLHNWEEMELNQYLYLNGEVTRLFLKPRGPDSGYALYPHTGSRHTYFDTTAVAHPLHEPAYIVEPRQPGDKIIPNGLPVFPVYYVNDDEGTRKLGPDSRLTFTAPSDGTYLVRVSDVRGFQSPQHKYTLTVRAPKPDFQVTVEGLNPTVNAGSGKSFGVSVERTDGFEGEVRVDITNLPPGFHVTTPLIIQAGHLQAKGTIVAQGNAAPLTPENARSSVITATAVVHGQQITKPAGSLGELKLGMKPKLTASLAPLGQPAPNTDEPPTIPEIVIVPGTTVAATLRAHRNGFSPRVQFNPHNLPHGVIVDNIGLNGILIPENETERNIFLTCDRWVPEQSRLIYLEATQEGNPTTWPVLLRVQRSR